MLDRIVRGEHAHNLTTKAVQEFKRFTVITFYLWVTFSLYVLDETVILGKEHINFSSQGFAIINALVLAKVLLVGENMNFARRFEDRPLIYPILYKALAFSILFLVFHYSEKVLIGLFHGKSVVQSLPHWGDGMAKALFCVVAILFVSLIPFFAYRELGRVIGEDELRTLMFKRGDKVFKLHCTTS
jgi:hypothetical protein